MEKSLDIFLDMYRFVIIACPLNVTNKQVARHIKGYLSGTCHIVDNIHSDINVDTLIICETKQTNMDDITRDNILSLPNPPKRICIVVGLGTNIRTMIELSDYKIPLLFASFCDIKSNINVKLYPKTSMNNNIMLTSPDLCDENSCKVEEESYIDDGQHYNINEAKIIHLTNSVTLDKLKNIVGIGEKQVYVYYDNYNKHKYEMIVEEFERILERYMELRITCSLYITLKGSQLFVET